MEHAANAVKVGTLREIFRYPVKSMLGESLQAATLGEKGIQYTPFPAQSDLLVGYVVALESALDDETIHRIYGLEERDPPALGDPLRFLGNGIP